ncbi:MAG: ABC transporter ATP-binding protein [Desulfosarcinaceae bacterium]|nr:ABC transporter ATP-binding protein [Desulfosarcinaceae bacterium]
MTKAIRVDGLSKCYRIGLKEAIHDSLGGVMIDFLKSPWRNYRKYRSLYRFDDLDDNEDLESRGIIWALKDISFNVDQGEVVGIIGRNGAGKSTLLKVLSKITHPTAGRAVIKGRISSLLEVGTGFHPELTGRENVFLNGTILGMSKREVASKFDEIVDFSGIEKFIDTPVKRYSSGMKVRLAFSVAAHLEPDLMVVDEVLAVGDARFQKKCLSKMEDVGSKGRTVLFVSHNMPALTRLCPRAILIEHGRVIEDGPSGAVVGKYLTSESGIMGRYQWDPNQAPGGEFARLLSVCIRDQENRVSDSVDIRQPITVEMEYEVLKGGHVLLPHFHFQNEEGVRAFTSIDQDPEWQGRARPAGRFTSSVQIPGNFLSEGMMYVTPALMKMNPKALQFAERDTIAFQVIDSLEGDSARGIWANNLGGVVRPLLNWQTKSQSTN